MAQFFTYLGRSRKTTHFVAMVIAVIALSVVFGLSGPTPFNLGLSLSIWFFFDGLLVAFAASYTDHNIGEFRGTDMVMGVAKAISAALVIAGVLAYKLLTK